MKKKLATALAFTAGAWNATAVNASPVNYEFSFTADDVLSYSFVNGADNSTAASNSLFDGARLVNDDGTGSIARTYLQSEHSAFTDWASSTTDRLTTLSLWGFGGLGPGWGEDFKHAGREMVTGPGNWADWTTVGWVPGLGTNPNPYTDKTAGWFANDFADALGLDDAGLASEEFRFRMSFETSDWLYGANTNAAPNTLGGPMTFWFGGWMGDADNRFKYLYEGNMVLTGTRQVPLPLPLPAPLMLLCIGLAGLGISRHRAGKERIHLHPKDAY